MSSNQHNPIAPIGRTNWRGEGKQFGIKLSDRLYHMYAFGKSGTGKTSLMKNMMIADIEQGIGFCLVDPHGDLASSILDFVPSSRIGNVLYFDPADAERPIAFNPLYNIPKEQHHLAASGLISIFKNLFKEFFGPRLEHILRFTLLTLLEYGEATLLDIQPLLTDPYFREHVLCSVTNRQARSFWFNEFEKYPKALQAEAIAPILNKVGIFSSSAILRGIVGQKRSTVHLPTMMDKGTVIIANLAKGALGEDVSSLLGSLLINSVQLAAMARASQPEHARAAYILYVDESHNFLTDSFVSILSECRKFGLGLFGANQYAAQLKDEIRAAIFGNIGTLVSFKVGSDDAAMLAREFRPVFSETDLISLPRYSMYLKLMIDAGTSKPFSADGLSPPVAAESFRDEVISASRERYAPSVQPEKPSTQPFREPPSDRPTLFDAA